MFAESLSYLIGRGPGIAAPPLVLMRKVLSAKFKLEAVVADSERDLGVVG